MKNLFICLACALFVLSCNNDVTESSPEESNIASLTHAKIGTLGVDEQIKPMVSEASLFNALKSTTQNTGLELQPTSYTFIEVDSKAFLRIYSKNDYVSTIEITKNSNNEYVTEGTVCTSKACAAGGGCLPNGAYCTECIPPDVQPGSGITGDCIRSTSGGPGDGLNEPIE